MSRRGRNNHEGGFYRPCGERTQTRANVSDRWEREIAGLRSQIVDLNSIHEEASHEYAELRATSARAREVILAKNREISELSEQCASWERKAHELQQANKKLQDFMETTKRSQWSVGVQRQEDLQLLTEKQTRLQEALQDSERRCVALEEGLRKRLAESEERHHLELKERDEDHRRDLSQRAEEFQRELSERDGDLRKHLSERKACLLELQRMMQENTELQTSLDESRRKCGALEEELSEKLRENEQRHLLDLAKRDEDVRRDLSQQAETFQREISQRDDILQNHLSERDLCLLELQRLREDNAQLKELFKKKEKKKSFWKRVFKKTMKTPHPSEPSSV